MTLIFRALCRSDGVRRALLVSLAVVVLVGAGLFVLDASGTSPEPVDFENTITTGIAWEQRLEVTEANGSVPRAQVFYSQYQFVTGYRGISILVDELKQPRHHQQFGRPVAVYVSDYSDTGLDLTAEGYPATETKPGWVDADKASFVVDSDAQRPGGELILPFSDREAAERFTDAHGGEILDWEGLQSYEVSVEHASAVRQQIDDRAAAGDRRLAAVRPLADREPSVVVGEDAPTIQAAIDAAPPETTIVVPPGTYEENPVVNKSVTIRGENATVRGDGEDSVIEVTGNHVAIEGLTITGVGEGTEPEQDEIDQSEWDSYVESGYGYTDAGIEADSADKLYVTDVRVETPTSGILLRDVETSAFENVSVFGTEQPMEGFMGVLSIRSRVVVQDSTFVGGRDGVYLHRAAGSVIRNNTFRDNRFGVHMMYTSDALIADNVASGQISAGITIMTEPEGNAVVRNEVRNTPTGITPSGSFNYVAENTLVDNEIGLMGGTHRSVYKRNVMYDNEIGFRTGSIRPTNQIYRNDFVANDQSVKVGTGPLRVWTYNGVGNFWSDRPEGFSEGGYAPTGTLDARLHDTDGVATLSASPAAAALDAVRNTVAGTRDGEVLDTAPLSEPVRPETIDELESQDDD